MAFRQVDFGMLNTRAADSSFDAFCRRCQQALAIPVSVVRQLIAGKGRLCNLADLYKSVLRRALDLHNLKPRKKAPSSVLPRTADL